MQSKQSLRGGVKIFIQERPFSIALFSKITYQVASISFVEYFQSFTSRGRSILGEQETDSGELKFPHLRVISHFHIHSKIIFLCAVTDYSI